MGFLGAIPIIPAIRVASDEGLPIVAAQPQSEAAEAFQRVAEAMSAQLASLSTKNKLPTLKL